MRDNLQHKLARASLAAIKLASTATSGSPFPLLAPSTTAPTISSMYLVRVNPSISLMMGSAGPMSNSVRKRFSSVVCFLRDESSAPVGSVVYELNLVRAT